MRNRQFLTAVVLLGAFLANAFAQTSPKPAPRTSAPSKPAAAPAAPPSPVLAPQAMTNADVVNMVGAGLAESIVTTAIRDAKARTFDLSPGGLITLKKAGVPDSVIAVMMNPAAMLKPVASTLAPPISSREVKVADGTEVRLRLLRPVSSENARLEDRVDFEVVSELNIDGVIVIDKGAAAVGRVTEAQSKRSFGRSGKLNFSIDSVKAIDGQSIRLRATRETKGADSYGKAGVVTILAGPFGAFVRGKDVEIPAGTEYSIYIDGDRIIQLKPAQ